MLAKNTWVMHDGKEYYFNGNGIMQRDKWVDTDYYVDANGVKRKNFFYDDGKSTYYLQNDGRHAKGLVDINNKTYVFDDDGKMEKDSIYELASPSYAVYVEKDGTLRTKTGYYDISSEKRIYVTNGSGKIARGQWIKNDDTGKYNFFDSDGSMTKNKVVETINFSDIELNEVIEKDSISSTVLEIVGAVSDNNFNPVYYYVDDEGNMLVNCTKEIDNVEWTFDKDGHATINLWKRSFYNNTNETYIINRTRMNGIYHSGSIENGKEAYLEIVVDRSDITFFLYRNKNKEQIKNNYIDDDYDIIMFSKVCSPSYNFTGTMSSKSDRIYVDQHQAITTLLNHLKSGTGFLIRITEDSSIYPKTYLFYVNPHNFPQVYDDVYGVKNGWKGDSYYVDNVMVTNKWQEYNGDWYYLGPNGVILKDQWVDNEYYVDKDGKMLKNTTTPDGYRVDENGKIC